MSLINEALKKAQSDRPVGDAGSRDHLLHMPGPPHKQPPRKRSPIWGFLLAVLIIGLFSASVTTILVYKILGEEETPPQTAQVAKTKPGTPAVETAAQEQPEPEAATPVVEAATEDPVVPEPIPAEAAGQSATSSAVVTVNAGEPVTVTPEQSLPAAEPVQSPPPVPNAAMWARLEELEIRGMMSGGTKVLIYDSASGKTRSFVEGDLIDGTLGLRISSIQSNSIVFEDYGGNELTKSF